METKKRLIDANALMDTLKKRTSTAYPNELWGLLLSQDFVENAPTVDAVEVVHGRWFAHHSHSYECTCCHAKYITMRAKDWNYCPNCGADMRGDEQ